MPSAPACNLRLILSGIGLVVFLGVFVTVSHAGPVTMTVRPSIAPNYYASPSWPLYEQRAMSSIQNNSGNIGNPATDPSAYQIIRAFYPGQIIVSEFPSWNGLALPPPPFNNEYGSRIHWGLHLVGDGNLINQFRLANLWNDMNSNDPWNSFNPPVEGFFGSSVYTSYLRGINYGLDKVKGGGDDILYPDSGADPSLLIDELIYVGVGNAYDTQYEDPLLPPQGRINSIIAFMASVPDFTVSNTYCLFTGDHSANPIICADSPVPMVPEPATPLLLAARRLRHQR